MIKWKQQSFDHIKYSWGMFNYSRRYPSKCTKKMVEKSHITCLEREALISDLIDRLECANRVIDSYGKLKELI